MYVFVVHFIIRQNRMFFKVLLPMSTRHKATALDFENFTGRHPAFIWFPCLKRRKNRVELPFLNYTFMFYKIRRTFFFSTDLFLLGLRYTYFGKLLEMMTEQECLCLH